MASDPLKLSLAAEFDDFCRYNVQYDNLDEEFLSFVRNQEECRKRWHAAELAVLSLQTENSILKTENKKLNEKLVHTKETLAGWVVRCEQLQEEKEHKSKQLELIREFVLNDPALHDETIEKLPFLQPTCRDQVQDVGRLEQIDESIGSVLSPSGDSLDLTDDEEEGCPQLRTSSSVKRSFAKEWDTVVSPPKRILTSCNGNEAKNADMAATATESKKFVAAVVDQPTSPALPSAPTHHSVPGASPLLSPAGAVFSPLPVSAAPPLTATPEHVIGSSPVTPVSEGNGHPPRRSNSAGKLASRAHNFCSKTLVRSESCGPCGKRIGFYKTALKCAACCTTCHPSCKEQVPLPCIQVSHMPTRSTSNEQKGTSVADHAPPTAPMVPSLVVHCAQEVERRGLSEVGLYRVPGSEQEVRDIRDHFQRGKGVPNMGKADIHAVCSTLKSFLRSLSETLITKSLWGLFVKAAEQEEPERVSAIWQVVTQLPQPNRDTLAVLVLHLQLVGSIPECKMPLSNLAKVFGSTVVGFSSSDVDAVGNIFYETEKQAQVMESILNVPADFWKAFVEVDSNEEVEIPERNSVPQSTLLGPIYDSWVKKTQRTSAHTPRRYSIGASRKKRFFPSPTFS